MKDGLKSQAKTVLYGFMLSFSAWYFGYQVGMFNSFFDPFIETVYGITDKAVKEEIDGNIQFFYLFGGLCSCFFTAWVYERIGRYKTTLLLLLFEITTILYSLQVSLQVLYLARFFHGYLTVSWTFVGPLMIKEIVPEQYRKVFGLTFYIFLTLGLLTSFGFGFDSAGLYWKQVFTLPLYFDIPKFLMFLFCFKIESPQWLYANIQDLNLRRMAIENSYKTLYIDEKAKEMTDQLITSLSSNQNNKQIQFSDLFTSDYRLQFIIGLVLNFLSQMTGINFLVFYSKEIFVELGLTNSSVLTFGLGIVNFLGALVVTVFNKKIKKKKGLIYGLAFQCLAYYLFLIGYTLNLAYTAVFGIYLFMFSFAISLGGIFFPYLIDIVPPIGIGIVSAVQWTLSTLIGKFAMSIVNKFGIFYVFFCFMWISAIGSIFMAGYGIHTENKSDNEIKEEFKNKKFLS